MPLDAPSLRRRIAEALEWTLRSLADEVHEVRAGSIARCRSLPLVHSVNRLQVTEALGPEDVLSLADEHQADLAYRHLEVNDAETAAALKRHVRALDDASSWKLGREVFMVLDVFAASRPARDGGSRGPDDAAPASPARLHGGEADELMRRWLAEDRLTKSRAHGGVGWVEDVYTVPEARRKGCARLLVRRAVDLALAARNTLTFIVADDENWPKHLYADLGFRPVGRTWTFHRDH